MTKDDKHNPMQQGQKSQRSDQQNQQAGRQGQQGGFPHEGGGWGHDEEQKIRADDYVESQPGGERDDLMDRQNQRQRRPTGI